MRKSFVVLLLLLWTAVPAFAGFTGPGSTGVSTAAAALKAADNAVCTLEGTLTRQIRADHYLFKDASGEMEVEIDENVFAGQEVTPATRVRLHGKVDVSTTKGVKVDVKRLEIVR